MQDNNTVQQLSDALNELLNAYDKLKNENNNLKEDKESLEKKVSDLEQENEDLIEKIEALTDTTQHHTNEIDTMLGRIKTILDTDETKPLDASASESSNMEEPVIKEEKHSLNSEGDLLDIVNSELTLQEEETHIEIEQTKPKNESSDKEIDLGRMQSLLNGFNN